jgi:hypothetical protein
MLRLVRQRVQRPPGNQEAYVKLKSFQESRIVAVVGVVVILAGCSRQSAQEKGAEMASTKIDMVAGVGEAMQAKGGKAGELVAAGVGTIFHGVERGAMQSGRAIAADSTLKMAGLSITKVQDATAKEGNVPHAFDVYVIATPPAAGTLRMFVYDALGGEIGRSQARVDLATDAAKYHTFALDPQVELSAVRKLSFTFAADGSKPGT